MSEHQYVVDTDPRFIALHAKVRDSLRNDERAIRENIAASMEECYAETAPGLVQEIRARFGRAMVEKIPPAVILGQYDSAKVFSDVLYSDPRSLTRRGANVH